MNCIFSNKQLDAMWLKADPCLIYYCIYDARSLYWILVHIWLYINIFQENSAILPVAFMSYLKYLEILFYLLAFFFFFFTYKVPWYIRKI